MNKHIIPLALVIIFIISIISGCGGGSGGVVPSVDDSNLQTVPEENPSGDPESGDSTGSFKVRVRLPEKNVTEKEGLMGSVIPEGYHTLRVIIDPEAIETDLIEEEDVSGGGTFEITVSGVPAGANTVAIQILTSSGALLAQRQYGFFMMPGATAGPSQALTLGVGIEGDGTCNPSEIYIPQGTTLFYENHDEVSDRTVKMNSDSISIGPISHVTLPADDDDVYVFYALSHLFDTPGTFNYDTGYGSPGRVVVYDIPEITSIIDDSGDAWDGDPNSTSINFTITGNDFGTDRDVVGGEVTFYKTYEWENVGSAGLSGGEGRYPRVFTDDNGIPYVAYRDDTLKLTVMKYTGNGATGWEPVGSSGFSDGEVNYPSLFIYDNVPYVAYVDVYNGGATVMEYTGGGATGWEPVGGSPAFSLGSISTPSLYIDDGTLYIAFRDDAYGSKGRVMTYNGTSWVDVGTGIFSGGAVWSPSLYVDNGVPYVAYTDGANDHKATVMKYEEGAWGAVGSAGFSSGTIDRPSIQVYNGTPYVAYKDEDNGNKISVYMYNGSGWDPVGLPLFSPGEASFSVLQIYNDEIYVAFRDHQNGYGATVMKCDGTGWSTVGHIAFSASYVMYTSFHIHNGTPYVAYMDGGNSNGATVMKFSREMKAVTPDEIPEWHNEIIEGSITIPAGKYRVEVTARGDNSTDDIYYGKGTGTHFNIIAE